MAKPFETLYAVTDPEGQGLEWEWDPEEMVFRATDSGMRSYVLRPTFGELEIDASDGEDEGTVED